MPQEFLILSASIEEALNKKLKNFFKNPFIMIIKNNSKKNEQENKLTVSNLIFLAISKLTIEELELIKTAKEKNGRIRTEELIKITSTKLSKKLKILFKELEELGSLRLITPTFEEEKRVELTEIGELIAAEVLRE